LLAILVVVAQTGVVAAAPASQTTTPITGTIKAITIIAGTSTTQPVILVTVLDSLGVTQFAYVSVENAVLLGLVTLDPVTQRPVVVQEKIGQPITIDPLQLLPPPATLPVTGTIQSITILPGTGTTETKVLVTIVDNLGNTQKVYLNVDTALLLGLVTLDPVTQLPVVVAAKIGQLITIDSTQLLTPPTWNENQPIAKILADHFDVDYDVIMNLQTQGFGFGEIAQAMFMAQKLGDISLVNAILNAKKTGDYTAFKLPDGSTPTNWGQLRKAVLTEGKNNLGVVVSSGHGNSSTSTSAPGNSGNAGSNGNADSNGNGHGNDKGNNGHGNNKP